ncbi:hypothetical protein ACFQ0B_64280 [Nonomuraea thailandensis]
MRFALDAGPISDTYALAYTWEGDGVRWQVAEPGKMVSDLRGVTGSPARAVAPR